MTFSAKKAEGPCHWMVCDHLSLICFVRSATVAHTAADPISRPLMPTSKIWRSRGPSCILAYLEVRSGGPMTAPGDSQSYTEYVDYVIAAERLGFHSAFSVEHHFTGFGQGQRRAQHAGLHRRPNITDPDRNRRTGIALARSDLVGRTGIHRRSALWWTTGSRRRAWVSPERVPWVRHRPRRRSKRTVRRVSRSPAKELDHLWPVLTSRQTFRLQRRDRRTNTGPATATLRFGSGPDQRHRSAAPPATACSSSSTNSGPSDMTCQRVDWYRDEIERNGGVFDPDPRLCRPPSHALA